MQDLYAIVGVSKAEVDAHDAAWLKKAYLRRAVQLHPDKPGGDKEQFQALQAAFEILSHADKRAAYDRDGWSDELQHDWCQSTEAGKVTAEELAAFERAYRGSEEEVNDVVRLYLDADAAPTLARLAEAMWFGSIDDEPRFREILELQIAAGNVERRAAFFAAETPAARQRRVRRAEAEAREAEQLAQEIQEKKQQKKQQRRVASSSSGGGGGDLVAMIQARNQERVRAFDAFEAKWAARAAEEGDEECEDDIVISKPKKRSNKR